MTKISFDKYKELIELIPLIQEAALKGLERDIIIPDFSLSHIKVRMNQFKQFFTLIQGKWSSEIWFSLLIFNELSFNELKRALPGINTRTLTDRLRLLEQRKIIIRNVKTESPLRVNYSLSDFGKEEGLLLVPVIINFLLPPRYKKNFQNINEIYKSVRESLNSESEGVTPY